MHTNLDFIVDNYPHFVSVYWQINVNTNHELSIQNLPRVMTHTSRAIATQIFACFHAHNAQEKSRRKLIPKKFGYWKLIVIYLHRRFIRN